MLIKISPWMKENNKGADVKNESAQWAQLAIQGPKAMELVKAVLSEDFAAVSYFKFKRSRRNWIVARTGYTGEDGVEVFLPSDDVVGFWNQLLEKGGGVRCSTHWFRGERHFAHRDEILSLWP